MGARAALAAVLAALALASAAAAPAEAGKPRLLVVGDSLAFDSKPFLVRALRRWRIVDEIWFARRTGDAAALLRRYGRRLPRTIHVSLGTADDPAAVDELRSGLRRLMRVAGRRRCVVWANVWRPVPSGPGFEGFNAMLAEEDALRPNLRILDWHAMVAAHPEWLKNDLVHVNADGNRARARAVRREIRACREDLLAAASAARPRLFVLGDSLGFDSWHYIRRALPSWRLEGDIGFARRTAEGAPILRGYGRRLPRAIHVSLGTSDDPVALDELRAQVGELLRAAGWRRCVIWANVWRPVAEGPGFDGFNALLAQEALARSNLRIVDWHSMVAAHPEWLRRDRIHVNADGNRARARAVRRELRACPMELAG